MALSLMRHHLWRPPWRAHDFMSGYLDFSILGCFNDHGYHTHNIHDHG
jgi:hypothetical protein